MTLFLLACFGLTYLVRSSSIARLPRLWLVGHSRFFRAMLACAFCTGFWCSLTVGAAMPEVPWRLLLPYALAGAGFAYGFDALVLLIETITEFLERSAQDRERPP